MYRKSKQPSDLRHKQHIIDAEISGLPVCGKPNRGKLLKTIHWSVDSALAALRRSAPKRRCFGCAKWLETVGRDIEDREC